MRPDRIRWVTGGLVAVALALVGRAAWVQLWQRDRWARQARAQQTADAPLPAPRGTIRDATGVVLAESREVVTIAVAPQEVRDRAALARALNAAGAPGAWVRRATDTARKWVELPTRFLPTAVAPAIAMRGVRSRRVAERVYVPGESVRRLVGRATPERGLDGVEYALDSLLRGAQGSTALVRDARGRTFASPRDGGAAATPGHAVTLTINQALQDIADRALADALAETGASGGDIVVVDPRDGALLALASRRPDPRSTAATALTEPFEPGSTLKPFVAARLLDLGRARTEEVVATHGGTWRLGSRTITDVHRAARLSLREVIAYSSNIGIVQFASRLAPREQYALLRDLGFGTPPGLPYPLEASGTLREPKAWSSASSASLAMGYEIAVTPVQLAVAYAAVANGGVLLQPALVRTITAPDGRELYRHRRRPLRRVMSPGVAAEIRRMLVDVVAEGTASGADLTRFAVGGKSGTARRTSGGRYAEGRYTASFVGLFPADDPQLVVLVKLDDPAGAIYGGKIAAPVARTLLQGALAAPDAALDRDRVAASARPSAAVGGPPRPRGLAAEPEEAAGAPGDVAVIVDLGQPRTAAPAAPPRAVPDVSGLALRRAVLALHQAGFHVRLGDGAGTDPAAGTIRPAGSLVTLGRGHP